MRFITCIAAVVALTGVPGCVPSKNPPFDQGDLVFEPAILGNWRQPKLHESPGILDLTAPEDQPLHRIERALVSDYRVVSLPPGEKPGTSIFQLFKLGDHYFVCDRLADPEFHFYRTMKVTVSGNRLILWNMDVEGILHSHPGIAKYTKGELTGSTAEVRQFLLAHADDADVWEVGSLLEREGILAVQSTGMTSAKQRTLDYWFALRAGLDVARVRIASSGWDSAEKWKEKASHIRRFTDPMGVDSDAVACGKLAADFCEAVAERIGTRPRPKDPFAAMVWATFGEAVRDPATMSEGREEIEERYRNLATQLEAARRRLSNRYGCRFPVVTDPASILKGSEPAGGGSTGWYAYAGLALVLLVGAYYVYYREFLSPRGVARPGSSSRAGGA